MQGAAGGGCTALPQQLELGWHHPCLRAWPPRPHTHDSQPLYPAAPSLLRPFDHLPCVGSVLQRLLAAAPTAAPTTTTSLSRLHHHPPSPQRPHCAATHHRHQQLSDPCSSQPERSSGAGGRKTTKTVDSHSSRLYTHEGRPKYVLRGQLHCCPDCTTSTVFRPAGCARRAAVPEILSSGSGQVKAT